MRMATDIRMNSDRIAKLLFLAVKVVEVVAPEIFDVARVDPAVTVYLVGRGVAVSVGV